MRLTLVNYNNGNATPTDVVDAQTALTQAETAYTTAIYGYLAGLSQLEYALGNGQQNLIAQSPSAAGRGNPRPADRASRPRGYNRAIAAGHDRRTAARSSITIAWN